MMQFNNNGLEKRISEVLYYVWDPIGVSQEPFARGEYEGYVQEILRLVEKNNEINEITMHLQNIIEDRVEITANKKHCEDTAKLLLEHKRAIINGCA